MSTDLQTGQESLPSKQPAFKATLADSTQASMVYSYILDRRHYLAQAQSMSTGSLSGGAGGSSTDGDGAGA